MKIKLTDFAYLLVVPLLLTLIFILHVSPSNIDFNCDPDYAFLFNSLNLANLKFAEWYDHPGTTGFILGGLFLRIAHFLIGKGNLVNDVIANPEAYLYWLKYLLFTFNISVVIWAGIRAAKLYGQTWFGVWFQMAAFAGISEYHKYRSDGLLYIFCLIITVMVLNLYYNIKNRDDESVAVPFAVIIALCLVTKLNSVAFALFPLVFLRTIRWRIYYLWLTAGLAFVLILPVIGYFYGMMNWFGGMAKSSELYGGMYKAPGAAAGGGGLMNPVKMLTNFIQVPMLAPVFFILLLAGTVALGMQFKNGNWRNRKFLWLLAVWVVVFAQLVITLKHFKIYYLTPGMVMAFALSPSIIDTFRLRERFGKHVGTIFLTAGFAVFIPFNFWALERPAHIKEAVSAYKAVETVYAKNYSQYPFIESDYSGIYAASRYGIMRTAQQKPLYLSILKQNWPNRYYCGRVTNGPGDVPLNIDSLLKVKHHIILAIDESWGPLDFTLGYWKNARLPARYTIKEVLAQKPALMYMMSEIAPASDSVPALEPAGKELSSH
ncbi:MAG: hypothetical protein V4543_09260 [Bacteroidota bacterium]